MFDIVKVMLAGDGWSVVTLVVSMPVQPPVSLFCAVALML